MSKPEVLSGNIDSGVQAMTLDEPITATILRDIRGIAIKLKFVLLPRVSSEDTLKELRNWDLWGPLILCLVLAVTLAHEALEGEVGDTFSVVFSLIWIGSAVVTVNAKLLNARISFFQSMCVLGYSLFPLVLGALLCIPIPLFYGRCFLVSLCFVWATRASSLFMAQLVKEERQILAIYPVLLFYLAVSWLILS
mmetsp:Transcript_2268/g.2569  ORF Transcript_2268/g.2569 Transcript_2268/m.2569 type:complete len:194 (+) Transcript_2268:149-730(+)